MAYSEQVDRRTDDSSLVRVFPESKQLSTLRKKSTVHSILDQTNKFYTTTKNGISNQNGMLHSCVFYLTLFINESTKNEQGGRWDEFSVLSVKKRKR